MSHHELIATQVFVHGMVFTCGMVQFGAMSAPVFLCMQFLLSLVFRALLRVGAFVPTA